MLKEISFPIIGKLPEGKYLILLNAMLFNIGWAACVLMRDHLALTVALCIVLFHLGAVTRLRREWVFIVVMLVIGLITDQIMVRAGLLQPTASDVSWVLWMGALWPMLASTLNHSLAMLQDRPLLSAMVGAVAGPFAYWTAIRLGAAQPGVEMLTLIISLSVLWCLLLPALYWLSRQLLVIR